MYLIAILVLCILIFVHELGHFLVAKWHKVGVLAFSIGFGPILWKKQKGETTYSLRLFPLGGFVRMAGDDPRALDPNFKQESEKENPSLEQLNPDEFTEDQKRVLSDRSKWFLLKGFWPKFNIVFAGPAFNFIFAVVLAIFSIFIYGEADPVSAPIIGDIVPGHAADKAGIKAEDLVNSINGREIADWTDLAGTIRSSGGEKLTFSIERKQAQSDKIERVTIDVIAEADRSGLVSDEERQKGDVYRIGIAPKFTRKPVGLADAVFGGTYYVWSITKQTLLGLKGLLLGHISSDNIAGPIRIFQEAGRSAQKGLEYLFGFMIFLSVSLAVLNLLPIPVLDGGHILFFIIEALIGSQVSIRIREVSTQVGFALLLALMIFAISNDIFR